MSHLKIGAVNYLNMMPWFSENPDMILFDTPREMNSALLEGKIDAACLSAIVGLKNKLTPLNPLCGIASDGPVQSVFIEPIINNFAQKNRWTNYLHKNSTEPYMTLFTTEASQQSYWLFNRLFAQKGTKIKTITIPKEDAFLSPLDFEHKYDCSGTLKALLTIGDPALWRQREFPSCTRIDLAEFWQNQTGLPCVFAAWFARKGLTTAENHDVCNMVLDGYHRWKSLSHAEKTQKCSAYSKEKQLPSDLYDSYLAKIQPLFTNHHRRTLAIYENLLKEEPH